MVSKARRSRSLSFSASGGAGSSVGSVGSVGGKPVGSAPLVGRGASCSPELSADGDLPDSPDLSLGVPPGFDDGAGQELTVRGARNAEGARSRKALLATKFEVVGPFLFEKAEGAGTLTGAEEVLAEYDVHVERSKRRSSAAPVSAEQSVGLAGKGAGGTRSVVVAGGDRVTRSKTRSLAACTTQHADEDKQAEAGGVGDRAKVAEGRGRGRGGERGRGRKEPERRTTSAGLTTAGTNQAGGSSKAGTTSRRQPTGKDRQDAGKGEEPEGPGQELDGPAVDGKTESRSSGTRMVIGADGLARFSSAR